MRKNFLILLKSPQIFEKEFVVGHSKKDEKSDTTKDDEKSKNELGDNAKEIGNSKNSQHF